AVFVLLWSTGWLVATYSNPYADPLTFLLLRFVLSIAVFGAITFMLGVRWEMPRSVAVHAVLSGLFLHTLYLGGVWWAIDRGVPTSMSGLLAALQPLLTALLAYWTLGERLTGRQRLGLGLGFVGLLLAITPQLLDLRGQQLAAALLPLSVNALAMLAVTIGTVYQKRVFHGANLFQVATLQFVGAALFMVPAVLLLEPQMRLEFAPETVIAMLWSVFGLSLGAVSLLLLLINRGQVSRAASLIYLIPPTVAIEAWLLFGEQLTGFFIAGTIVVVFGVWLVNKAKTPKN
ncbi:MAG: DMT family transporter, partial [Pseudomonadota bacterium]